jgi:hypothetical protein
MMTLAIINCHAENRGALDSSSICVDFTRAGLIRSKTPDVKQAGLTNPDMNRTPDLRIFMNKAETI